jgi:hypothetical protein
MAGIQQAEEVHMQSVFSLNSHRLSSCRLEMKIVYITLSVVKHYVHRVLLIQILLFTHPHSNSRLSVRFPTDKHHGVTVNIPTSCFGGLNMDSDHNEVYLCSYSVIAASARIVPPTGQ